LSYLIWSNQKGLWWRANQSGYTGYIEEAGQYSQKEAQEIIDKSTCNGLLVNTRTDSVTGEAYTSYDEVMVAVLEESRVS
jgi:hypothetical protein